MPNCGAGNLCRPRDIICAGIMRRHPLSLDSLVDRLEIGSFSPGLPPSIIMPDGLVGEFRAA